MQFLCPKVYLPLAVLRNPNLSPRAKIIWGELTTLERFKEQYFVVNTKVLAKNLNCCPSTLRRAIKSLLEHKLIEYVDVTAERHRIYRFTTLTPKLKQVEPVKIETQPVPVIKKVIEPVEPAKVMTVCYNLRDRKITPEDMVNLEFADVLYPLYGDDLRRDNPSLNGLKDKPKIDISLLQYITMRDRNKHVGFHLLLHIRETLKHMHENPFVIEDDMHVEWR